jgi:capsular polysaccharide biosynthesis protein
MDLRLFWAVMKRYKRITIPGTLLAAVLAVFAYGTPGPHGITPRAAVTYESQAQLLITQTTGPYGRADSKTVAVGDPGYMSSLAPIYAGIANGSAVQAAVRASKIPGTVSASEGIDPNTGDYTPFVNITADSPTPAGASKLAQVAVTTFQNYVTQMENQTGTPQASRVTLDDVRGGLPPVIASKPKPTIPVLIFVAIVAAMIMLVFSLENNDPQTAARLGRVPATRAVSAEQAADGVATLAPRPSLRSTAGPEREHAEEQERNGATRSPALERLLKRG